jgi:hypothetical protein
LVTGLLLKCSVEHSKTYPRIRNTNAALWGEVSKPIIISVPCPLYVTYLYTWITLHLYLCTNPYMYMYSCIVLKPISCFVIPSFSRFSTLAFTPLISSVPFPPFKKKKKKLADPDARPFTSGFLDQPSRSS